jgi:hypothetical protein
MKQKPTLGGTSTVPNPQPTANICINKSRVKIYNKDTTPTVYLEKGTEITFELYNPTSDNVLVKIYLNNKTISETGLILKPAQRVFLERYLDKPQKFLFDTYEVNNTQQNLKTVENNGDFKVEFFKEKEVKVSYPSWNPQPYWQNPIWYYNTQPLVITYPLQQPYNPIYGGLLNNNSNFDSTTLIGTAVNNYYSSTNLNLNGNVGSTLTTSTYNNNLDQTYLAPDSILSTPKTKTIETGRIEAGSASTQSFDYVNMEFESYSFYNVSYKLLPLSSKVNTVEDLNVKRYCSNCSAKITKTDKFCSSCGSKL